MNTGRGITATLFAEGASAATATKGPNLSAAEGCGPRHCSGPFAPQELGATRATRRLSSTGAPWILQADRQAEVEGSLLTVAPGRDPGAVALPILRTPAGPDVGCPVCAGFTGVSIGPSPPILCRADGSVNSGTDLAPCPVEIGAAGCIHLVLRGKYGVSNSKQQRAAKNGKQLHHANLLLGRGVRGQPMVADECGESTGTPRRVLLCGLPQLVGGHRLCEPERQAQQGAVVEDDHAFLRS